MTTPSPAIIDWAAHASDPTPGQIPWWIEETFSSGTTFTPTSHSTHVYGPGGEIERVIGSFLASRTDSNMLALVAACDPTISDPGPAFDSTWTTTQQDWDIQAGDGSWPSTLRWSQNLYVAWQRITSDVTIAADTRAWWGNLIVLHRRYNYASQPIDLTTATPPPVLTARGIVEDLMGRGLNQLVEYEPARVDPATPWTSIVPHATWWDSASAREVLAFANTHAPGMWWGVAEPGPSGLPKFVVGRWNGPARYVLPPNSVELAGGATDVANRCLVRFNGAAVRDAKIVWVAEVRANIRTLADAGLVRTMSLDLTQEPVMTTAEARVRGLTALAEAAQAKTSGRAIVSHPILDLVDGRMVEPWELVPGSTVIVPDVPASYDRSTSLTESVGADGVSVFRCRTTSFEVSSGAATLDLDGGYRSLAGRLKTETARRRYDVGSPLT